MTLQHLKKTKYLFSTFSFLLLAFIHLKAQPGTLLKSNQTYLKFSLTQAINLGRPAFQIGMEKNIAPKTTASADAGWIMNYGYSNLPSDRKNGNGFQLSAAINYYPFGLSSNNAKIFFSASPYLRKYNFDANLTAAISSNKITNFSDGIYFQNVSDIHYNITSYGLNLIFGTQINISQKFVLDIMSGFGPKMYNVKHNFQHKLNYYFENFNSPFVGPSNQGNYTRAGFYFNVNAGFLISKA